MPSNDMIERVARAICKEWFLGSERTWQNFLPAARAAIEAMREPTPLMLASAWAKINAEKKLKGIARLGPGAGFAEFYEAAIDAALHPMPEE